MMDMHYRQQQSIRARLQNSYCIFQNVNRSHFLVFLYMCSTDSSKDIVPTADSAMQQVYFLYSDHHD